MRALVALPLAALPVPLARHIKVRLLLVLLLVLAAILLTLVGRPRIPVVLEGTSRCSHTGQGSDVWAAMKTVVLFK